MSFYSKKTRTARKRHRCGETGLFIEPGTRYVCYAGVWEGDFYSAKMLEPLAEMFDRYNDALWRDHGEGLEFGALCAQVFDSLKYDPTPQLVQDAELFASLFAETPGSWMREAIDEAKLELSL